VTASDVNLKVDRLHGLLARQLELIRQGNVVAAEALCEQTDPLVRAMVTLDTFHGADGADWRRSLEQLYRELCLMLTAQRTETSTALQAVRRGKRMLRTYGNHLSPR
jgi:hypothetical protein